VKNKRLQKYLLFLVLAIWGMVAFRIYGTVAAGNEPPGGAQPPSSHTDMKASFVYKADVRDPFYFPLSATRHSDSTNSSVLARKQVWMPPPLKLTGILQNKAKKKTAILENSAGGVFFLSEGDTLSGARILKIGSNEVSYLFLKQKSQWTLETQ
jgi:hypothetical protein